MSSSIWVVIVTAVVLLIAASASAQDSGAAVPPLDGPAANALNGVGGVAPISDMPVAAPVTSGPADALLPPTMVAATDSPTPAPAAQTPMTSVTTAAPNATSAESGAGLVATTTIENVSALAERQTEVSALQLRLQEKRAILENASSTRQPVLRADTQNLVVNGVGQAATALASAIARTKEVVAGLRTRASTIADLGGDTVSALNDINQAEATIALAEEALRDIDVSARFAATSREPLADWGDARRQFSLALGLITAARDQLRSASLSLRSELTTN